MAARAIFFLGGRAMGADLSLGRPNKLHLLTPTTSLQCELGGHRGQSEKWGAGKLGPTAPPPPVEPLTDERRWEWAVGDD